MLPAQTPRCSRQQSSLPFYIFKLSLIVRRSYIYGNNDMHVFYTMSQPLNQIRYAIDQVMSLFVHDANFDVNQYLFEFKLCFTASLFDFLQMQVVACKYLALGSCVVPTVGALWLLFSRPFSNGKDDNFVRHHAVRLVDSARIGSSTFLFSEIENQVL